MSGFWPTWSDCGSPPTLNAATTERLSEVIGLKIRLNLLITAALVISVALSAMLLLHNYRRAISKETEALAQVALGLLRATRDIRLGPTAASQFPERLGGAIPRLTHVRHVRLESVEAARHALTRSPVPFSSATRGARASFTQAHRSGNLSREIRELTPASFS